MPVLSMRYLCWCRVRPCAGNEVAHAALTVHMSVLRFYVRRQWVCPCGVGATVDLTFVGVTVVGFTVVGITLVGVTVVGVTVVCVTIVSVTIKLTVFTSPNDFKSS